MAQGLASDAEGQLRLGETEYSWDGSQLCDVAGQTVPLRAKSLQMFSVLLADRGHVVSKDTLSELVWPGTVATDESIARCIADIRKALGDREHNIVETFPRQGYRLNVGVISPSTSNASRVRAPVAWVVGICAALAVGAGLWALSATPPTRDAVVTEPTAQEEPALAVAVLPFEAGSEADQFLAAGLSDDLEIHLAELSAIKTVSQAFANTTANSAEGPIAQARALNARYLVTGRVQQNEADVAISVRLIDGADGTMLWADRYEGPRDGLLAFRHRLPEALTARMSVVLDTHDMQRLSLRDTNNAEAFEAVMMARREISAFTYANSLTAERHLRRAIALDPLYAHAYAELAAAFAIRFENGWVVLSDADAERAFHFAERALEIYPDLWLAHYALGRLHSVLPDGASEDALEHLQTAMSLQPADDDARAYFAVVTSMAGRPEEALRIFEDVIAANAHPPFWYFLGLGTTLFHLERYEEAESALQACLQQMPNSPHCLRTQIANHARLGQAEDAAWAIEEYTILGHAATLEAMMNGAIEKDPDMRAFMADSFRLAGVK